MVGFLDLFGPNGGFPFGGSAFANGIQTGDIGGSPSWGKPPVPGVSGAAPEQLAGVVPGGRPVAPPGLLSGGGGDDTLAGGTGEDQIPPNQLQGGATPFSPGGLNPAGRTPSMISPTANPMGFAGMHPTPPSGAPGGTMGSPGTGPAFAQASSMMPNQGPGTPPTVSPEQGLAAKMKGLADNKAFMGGAGKLAGALKGSPSKLDMAITPTSGYDPSGASRANAAKMLEALLTAKKQAPGGAIDIPGLLTGGR